VKNWNERTIAARVVGAAPGVTKVKNDIEVAR
jgi:osmotically-inducible protein OsmY